MSQLHCIPLPGSKLASRISISWVTENQLQILRAFIQNNPSHNAVILIEFSLPNVCKKMMKERQYNKVDLKITTCYINWNMGLDIVRPITKIIQTWKKSKITDNKCSIMKELQSRDFLHTEWKTKRLTSGTSNCISMRMSNNNRIDCSYPDRNTTSYKNINKRQRKGNCARIWHQFLALLWKYFHFSRQLWSNGFLNICNNFLHFIKNISSFLHRCDETEHS